MRVFVKQGKFWLATYDKSLGRDATKPLGIDADIPFEKGNPDWWKKSKHRAQIKERVEEWTHARATRTEELPLRVVTIETLMQRFAKEAELNRDEPLAPASVIGLRDAGRFYARNTNTLPRDLTTADVRIIRSEAKKTLAPRTIRNYFSNLSSAFKFGVKQGWLRSNPFEGVRVKVEPSEPKEIPVELMLSHLSLLPRGALTHAILQILIVGRVGETCTAKRSQDHGDIFAYWNAKKRRWEDWPMTTALRFALDNLLGKDYLCHHRSRNALLTAIRNADGRLKSHDYKRFAVQQAEEQDPPKKILDAIAHHAPKENVIIRGHYSKNRLSQMRPVLEASQKPILDFLRNLGTP